MQDNNLEDVVRFLNKKTYWNTQTVPDNIKEAKEDFISSINYNSLLEDEDVSFNLNEDFELLVLKYDLSEQQALGIVSSVISEKWTLPSIPRGVKDWWDSFKGGMGFGKPPKADIPEPPKPTKPEAPQAPAEPSKPKKPEAPEAPAKKPTPSPEAQARKQELERRRAEREQRAQQRKMDSERRRLEADKRKLEAERAKTPKQKAPEAPKPKKPEAPEAPKPKKPGIVKPLVTGIGVGAIAASGDDDESKSKPEQDTTVTQSQSSTSDSKLTPDQKKEYDRKMDQPTSPGGPSSRDIHKDIADLSKEDPEAEAAKRAFADKQSSYEKTARDMLAARNKHTGIDSDIDSTINKLKKDGKESTWKNFIRQQGDENITLKVGQ